MIPNARSVALSLIDLAKVAKAFTRKNKRSIVVDSIKCQQDCFKYV